MGPAIDCDRHDVARGIETSRSERSRQAARGSCAPWFQTSCCTVQCGRQCVDPVRAARLARSLHHVNHDRLLGLAGAFIPANADCQVEIHARVIAARSIDRIRVQLLKRSSCATQRWYRATELSAPKPEPLSAFAAALRRCTESPRASTPECVLRLRGIDLPAARIGHFHLFRRWRRRPHASPAPPYCSIESSQVTLPNRASNNWPSREPHR